MLRELRIRNVAIVDRLDLELPGGFVALTGQSSDLAIVLTTLIAAASYTPLRRRLESLADRYLKYDTPRFGAYRAQLRSTLDVLDPNAVADRMVRQIVDELGAVGGRVELALGRERMVAEAGAPIGTVAVTLDLGGPGGPLGRVVLGPRATGQRYRDDEIEAIGDIARMAARALELRLQRQSHPASARPRRVSKVRRLAVAQG